ncbi:MAG TPA: hypothetical protein VE684_18375 [Crenalkalicoccus sp.]|jgi:cell division septation protein DedD|nr:hypothetical protein [Crenalkalicoccus sp.]
MTLTKQRDAGHPATQDPRRPTPPAPEPQQATATQHPSQPTPPPRSCVIGRQCDAHYAYLLEPHD